MSAIQSFLPLSHVSANLLVLGSMPGAASLTAGQYYAHPRNVFWSIASTVTGVAAAAPYSERCAALVAHGIALWDVLAQCRRLGSLDSKIDRSSAVINPLGPFLQEHHNLRRILLNGATAAYWFAPIAAQRPDLQVLKLPSTSPANASWTFARKQSAWLAALRGDSR